MHERFGREWEEKWQQHRDEQMFPYPEEYYRLLRKEYYDDQKRWKGNLEHWEHDGFGYIITMQQDMGSGEWHLSRVDLTDYCSVGYRFLSQEQMDVRIRREGWRPFEQVTLGLEV